LGCRVLEEIKRILFDKFDFGEFVWNNLGDSHAGFDVEDVVSGVVEDDSDFSLVIGIDCSGCVEDDDSEFGAESASGADLNFIAIRNVDFDSGLENFDLSWFERDTLCSSICDVEPG